MFTILAIVFSVLLLVSLWQAAHGMWFHGISLENRFQPVPIKIEQRTDRRR